MDKTDYFFIGALVLSVSLVAVLISMPVVKYEELPRVNILTLEEQESRGLLEMNIICKEERESPLFKGKVLCEHIPGIKEVENLNG